MMELLNKTDDERGQVGIGTLIVFIALVLVAAIAAGVLINTAGFLQTQAEATGEESTQQVADNLNVESTLGNVVGYDNDADGVIDGYEVDEVDVVVSLSPGASEINLADLTVEYLSPYGADTLTYTDAGAVSGGSYDLSVITAENEGDLILSDNADRYMVVLDLAAVGGSPAAVGDALQPGDSAELVITTPQGSQRTLTLGVPDSLTEEGDVRL